MSCNDVLKINLDYIKKGLIFEISSTCDNTLFYKYDAHENCESEYQLIEGCTYEYEFNDSKYYMCRDQIVTPSKRKKQQGIIGTNTFVGTLSIPVYCDCTEVGTFELEVQSIKEDYRNDYRQMISQITEKCTELIMKSNSMSSHRFDVDYTSNSKILLQKFEFIKSIIEGGKFRDAIQRILSNPVSQWLEVTHNKDIRKIKRINNSNLKQIARGGSSRESVQGTYFTAYGINYIPKEVETLEKVDSYDTPENRFVKFTLEEYLRFCIEINNKSSVDSRMYRESSRIIEKLQLYLSNEFFKEISNISVIPLNSPMLQRKEGYREVLKFWSMFDIAAKITWVSGEEVYGVGKRNVALLYEYWIFFVLLETIGEIFDIESQSIDNIIKVSPDDLELQLKKGRELSIYGKCNIDNVSLKMRFGYNRLFRKSTENKYSGSWSVPMQPDYTLSFWPENISERLAEERNLIAHLHFDAKYKVNNLRELINFKTKINEEETSDQNKGESFKNVDIIKMHAYKDAIKGTYGSYIIYPGTNTINLKEGSKILPGVGAFAIYPNIKGTNKDELKNFLISSITYLSKNF